ncbi:MAG: CIA30 family protein [Gemmatimonadales bacterium]|jgi:monofunctional biosynthetic peptidoglycan transglycosylase|nr:MAG: CIA30 family protein [Gemmatimonadales bacterium]
MSTLPTTLLDFADATPPRFQPVDDRVMGGRSMSRMRTGDAGVGIFEGVLSPVHDGGFASVRANLESLDLSDGAGIVLRVRGDGRRYRVTLRNDRRMSGTNHQARLEPPADDWAEVVIPFGDFRPRLRGREVPDAAPLDPSRIRQVGFVISDGQAGPFRLEVAWARGWDGKEPLPE